MDAASKDVLFTIAMDLDLPNLLRWCSSISRINKNVCLNDNLWRSKLLRDYPDYLIFNLNKSLRETYVFMYQLSYIKKLLDTDESLYDIFLSKKLNFSKKGLETIPALDLPNLEVLDLSINDLEKVPRFNLPNLRYLDLRDNRLTQIPTFDLPNLQNLRLSYNYFTEDEKSKLKIIYRNKVDF